MRRFGTDAMATLPPDTRRARSFRVQPTPTGVVVAVALVLFLLVGPDVSDPDMAGFMWAAIFGLLIVGVIWPCATVLLVRVAAASGPQATGVSARPGRVGASMQVPLRLGARLSEVSLRWIDAAEVAHVAAGPADRVDLPMTPVRRGEFERLRVRVSCDAPFGLVVASRAIDVSLARPLLVGPATPVSVDLPEPETGGHGQLTVTAVGHGGDTIRSVRPYVTGDPAHLVHWPSTAHTGTLVVRELEPPADRAVAVVVDLGVAAGGPDGVDGFGGSGRAGGVGHAGSAGADVMPTTSLQPDELPVENAVARAAVAVATLRARGVRVLLCTAEPAGTVEEVGDDGTAMTRLARATTGAPGAVPPGWSVIRFAPTTVGSDDA